MQPVFILPRCDHAFAQSPLLMESVRTTRIPTQLTESASACPRAVELAFSREDGTFSEW